MIDWCDMQSSPFKLRAAVRVLLRGGVIAYPTEAVYGLGCDPLQLEAVRRIVAIKRRSLQKGLILVAARFEQLLPYVEPLDEARMRPVWASWPGPNSWLLPARRGCPWWLTGGRSTLAVRVSAHPLTAALCDAAGFPLVSTSANRAGQPPARTALQVRCRLGDGLDLILSGATGGRARPSTLRDARSGAVLRAG